MATVVIYDGDCDFCKSCVAWVQNRTNIDAIPNQSINPDEYGITKSQCEKSVVVIDNGIYFGAKAIAILLNKSGHRLLAIFLKFSGPIGELGYKYVASHRSGRFVNLLHRLIRRTTVPR